MHGTVRNGPRLIGSHHPSVAVGNETAPMRSPGLLAGQVPSAGFLIGLWVLGDVHASLLANVAAELATILPGTAA
jgi:hypothetical protein